MVASPPSPFEPLIETWEPRSLLYRVLRNTHRSAEFNPGFGPPTRFAFFHDPPVPALYAAASPQAAVAETIVHDLPLRGGQVGPEDYLDRIMVRLLCRRALRLAQFCGPGLRKLRVFPRGLTDTDAVTYRDTVRWAEAVWRETDCDGIVWMSRHWNTDRAVVLFGDRVSEDDLSRDSEFARAFINPNDLEWLAGLCQRIGIAFAPPG